MSSSTELNKMALLKTSAFMVIRSDMIWRNITRLFSRSIVRTSQIQHICSARTRSFASCIRNFVCCFRLRDCTGENRVVIKNISVMTNNSSNVHCLTMRDDNELQSNTAIIKSSSLAVYKLEYPLDVRISKPSQIDVYRKSRSSCSR